MSLIGQTTALISLGSSCQTAQQLRANAHLVSGIFGEDMAHVRLPFDWVVSSPASTAGWLDDGLAFPAGPAELTPMPEHSHTFLWRRRTIYFWHDFQGVAGPDLEAGFAFTAAQYAWSASQLRAVADLRRVILIVGNTQNNLPQSLPADDAFENYVYSAEKLVALKAAAEGFLNRPCEMLCVTYPQRCADGLRGMPSHRITVARISQDGSLWEGQGSIWGTVLSRYLAPARIAA